MHLGKKCTFAASPIAFISHECKQVVIQFLNEQNVHLIGTKHALMGEMCIYEQNMHLGTKCALMNKTCTQEQNVHFEKNMHL